MKRRILAAVLAGMLLFSGCSAASAGGTEVEGLMLIRSVGIDAQQGTGLSKPARITVCTGVGLNQEPPTILTREETSVSAAVEALKYNATGLQPFYSHTQQVVLGEEAAKSGLSSAMDWMLRSMEIRLDTEIYVVRGNTAETLFTQTEGASTSVSDMLSLLRESAPAIGSGYAYDCGEIAASLLANGCALIQAVELQPTDTDAEGSGKGVVIPAGYAVISGDRLAGYTLPGLTYAVCVLTNHLRHCVFQVVTEDGEFSVSLENTSASYTPVFAQDGNMERVEVFIQTSCTVVQMESGADLVSKAVRDRIAAAAEERMVTNASSVLRQSAEMDVDYLDIGGACRRKAPGRFDAMPETWKDQFAGMEYSVSAQVRVEQTYDLIHPVEKQEGKTS